MIGSRGGGGAPEPAVRDCGQRARSGGEGGGDDGRDGEGGGDAGCGSPGDLLDGSASKGQIACEVRRS